MEGIDIGNHFYCAAIDDDDKKLQHRHREPLAFQYWLEHEEENRRIAHKVNEEYMEGKHPTKSKQQGHNPRFNHEGAEHDNAEGDG